MKIRGFCEFDKQKEKKNHIYSWLIETISNIPFKPRRALAASQVLQEQTSEGTTCISVIHVPIQNL